MLYNGNISIAIGGACLNSRSAVYWGTHEHLGRRELATRTERAKASVVRCPKLEILYLVRKAIMQYDILNS